MKKHSISTWKKSWIITISVLALVVAVGLTVSIYAVRYANRANSVQSNKASTGQQALADLKLVDYHSDIHTEDNNTAPAPTSEGIQAKIASLINRPELAPFAGRITDAQTGTELWQQDASQPMIPASSLKVLTAAAALLSLPFNHRIDTTVLQGPTPDSLVLVGFGDPTLSAVPLGTRALYRDAPRIQSLANQIQKTHHHYRHIYVDSSLFSGPEFSAHWERPDITNGDITPLSALTADGGRLNPTVDYSPRTATPALAAGQALANYLGLPPTAVSAGSAINGAKQIAHVTSAPLIERLRQMLLLSDNVLAETVGLEVAQQTGSPLTIKGGVEAVRNVLTRNNIDLTNAVLFDTNGLSEDDRVPPLVLSNILTLATSDGGIPQLRSLLDLLPVAGETGTLANRFTGQGRIAAGFVRAKTGTLRDTNALAGTVTDVEGHELVFALISNSDKGIVAQRTLDNIATALRTCGCHGG